MVDRDDAEWALAALALADAGSTEIDMFSLSWLIGKTIIRRNAEYRFA